MNLHLISRVKRCWLLPLLLLWTAVPLQAQEVYPSRAINLVIPLSAGSQVDVLGRALADSISKQAGHPVVVHNREGAGMVLAGVAATTAVVLGSELPEVRSPAFRRMFWLACAMPVAARLGGDLGWALVTLGVVGGPVYAWPGSPALGVHPSACSVLTLGVALVATAILGWRAGRSSSSERS